MRAEPHRLDRRLHRRVGGHQDHLHVELARAHAPQHLDAVDARHRQVAQKHVGRLAELEPAPLRPSARSRPRAALVGDRMASERHMFGSSSTTRTRGRMPRRRMSLRHHRRDSGMPQLKWMRPGKCVYHGVVFQRSSASDWLADRRTRSTAGRPASGCARGEMPIECLKSVGCDQIPARRRSRPCPRRRAPTHGQGSPRKRLGDGELRTRPSRAGGCCRPRARRESPGSPGSGDTVGADDLALERVGVVAARGACRRRRRSARPAAAPARRSGCRRRSAGCR